MEVKHYTMQRSETEQAVGSPVTVMACYVFPEYFYRLT